MNTPVTTGSAQSLVLARTLTHGTPIPRTIERSGEPPVTISTTDPVVQIGFNPAGTLLAAAGASVSVWDVASGVLRGRLDGDDGGYVEQVAFAEDRSLLLVMSGNRVMLWPLDGVPESLLTLPERTIRAGATTPERALVVAHAAPDGSDLRLVDARSGEDIATFAMPQPPTEVFFSEDGSQLLAFTSAGLLRLWNALDPTAGADVVMALSEEMLYLGFSAPYLVTRARNGSAVHVWDVATGQPVGPSLTLVHAHDAAFNADRSLMAITSTRPNAGVEIHDVQSGALVHTLGGGYPAAFSPDGTTLACGASVAGQSYEVQLWQVGERLQSEVRAQCSQPITLKSSDKVGNLAVLNGHSLPVTCVAVSPDGQWVASGSADKTVRVWNPRTGDEVITLRDHTAPVTGVVFSPDGRTLVSSSGDVDEHFDNTVRVYSLVATENRLLAQPQLVFEGHRRRVSSVDLSPDGSLVGSADMEGRLLLWEIASGEIRHEIAHAAPVNDVAFSPDGTLVAVAVGGETDRGYWEADNSVRLWNVKTGDLYAVLKRHQDWVMHTIFSPDGHIAAAIDYRKRLYGWDIGSQHIVLDQAESTAVAITASDDLAAVAHTTTHIIQLMNPQTGAVQARLAGHRARINQLAFSGDHSLLASASDDTSVRLWGVPQPGQTVIVTEEGAPPVAESEAPQPFTLRLVRLECLRGQEIDGDEVYIKVADRTVWDVLAFKYRMHPRLIAGRTTNAFNFRAVTYRTNEGWQVAENYHPDDFIFSGQTEPVKVQLWEADSFLRGGDDLLGEVIVTPESVRWDEVECEFHQGRAHYRLTYAVFDEGRT